MTDNAPMEPLRRWDRRQYDVAAAMLNALMELPPEARCDGLVLVCKAYVEIGEVRGR